MKFDNLILLNVVSNVLGCIYGEFFIYLIFDFKRNLKFFVEECVFYFLVNVFKYLVIYEI